MTLRLLLLTDAVGGVWVYSVELARALAPLGVETVLAVMGPSPTPEQRADAPCKLIDTGLPLDWLDTDAHGLGQAGQAIAEIAARERVDLVQTCSAALLADADFGAPCVAVQHSCLASWWAAVEGTSLPQEFAWRTDLVARGLRRPDAVVAPSAAFAAETQRLYGLGSRVLAVYNGRSAASARDVPQGEFVLTASRLWDKGKNVATLDAAAASIDIPVQAAGAARGPDGSAVELAHMRELGALSPSRLSGLMAARPIFASAALYEPFGLSVLEAAQAGCALVLSDIATHRELWGDAAVFVPARDAAAFAEAINALSHDRKRRELLGRAAQERAGSYTPERMAHDMTAVYAQIAGGETQRRELASVA